MNISTTRNGIGASALLFAFAMAAPVFGQSPPSTDKPQDKGQQDKGQHGTHPQGQQGQQGQQGMQGMEQIGNAYKQLHQVTLNALQEQARSWKDKPVAGTVLGTDSASSQSLSLRGEELMIAACPGGLLAGAPSGTANHDARKPATPPANDKNDGKDDNKQGTQPNPDRSSQGAGAAGNDGQSVGMILVHANTLGGATAGRDNNIQKGDKGPQEASGDGEGATRNASSGVSAGALKPGVYCVKQSGSSVWLTDQQGQIVLRTTLDAKSGNKPQTPNEVGGQNRESDLGLQRAGGHGEWEQVFGAIAKEAMHSMGWAKQGAVATLRQ